MTNYEKKYKEALERARCYKGLKAEMEVIFPELAESEDEKNRKHLIERLKWELQGAEDQDSSGCNRQKDIEAYKWGIAWLEKQKSME